MINHTEITEKQITIPREEIEDVAHQIARKFNPQKIILFGSYARGDFHPYSDIDLLVEFEPGTDDLFGKKQKLKALLKSSFDREVDICREKYIKPYLKSHLLREAIHV